jgi:prophage regulatory protein
MPDHHNGKDTSPLHHLRIITQKDLRALVPYTPQHVLRLEKAGKFPRRLQLGQNRVGWRLIDIEAWIAARTPKEIYRADPEAAEIF